MAFLWKKERTIIHKITNYLNQIDTCAEIFQNCLVYLIETGISSREDDVVEKVHEAESLADDLRREIEFDLYNKALIPEIRGDILGILETIDKIPNMFQSVCFQIHLQKIEIPGSLQLEFKKLMEINLKSYKLIKEALDGFFLKKNILALITAVDELESESDRVERRIIKGIFELDIAKADKILLKEIVINIGNISDYAQSVSDRLNLTIIKRRI